MKKSRGKHPTGTIAPSGMRMGAGPVPGAGMLNTGGPGKAAMRVKPRMAGANFQGGANSYSPPGMKTTNQGE